MVDVHDVPVLDLRDVTWLADDRVILDAITWRIDPGQHWAILGPNGAGKTTLLNLACGYLWPNGGGTILRNGEDLLDLRELRRGIGWVTASLALQIPRCEQVLHTVLSGQFAQVGYIEWEPPSDDDLAHARRASTSSAACTWPIAASARSARASSRRSSSPAPA